MGKDNLRHRPIRSDETPIRGADDDIYNKITPEESPEFNPNALQTSSSSSTVASTSLTSKKPQLTSATKKRLEEKIRQRTMSAEMGGLKAVIREKLKLSASGSSSSFAFDSSLSDSSSSNQSTIIDNHTTSFLNNSQNTESVLNKEHPKLPSKQTSKTRIIIDEGSSLLSQSVKINKSARPSTGGVKSLTSRPITASTNVGEGGGKGGGDGGGRPGIAKLTGDPIRDFEFATIQLKTSKDWDVTCDAIETLRVLLPDHTDYFKDKLHDIIISICSEISNLRSAVSKAAICFLGELFIHLGKWMDTDLELSVGSLLKKGGESTGFIIEEVDKALQVVPDNVTFSKLIPVLLARCDHRNPSIRLRASILISKSVASLSSKQLAKWVANSHEMDKFLPVLAALAKDGNKDTRMGARQTLEVMSVAPDFDKTLDKNVNPSQRKELVELLRKMKINSPVSPVTPLSSKRGRGMSKVSTITKNCFFILTGKYFLFTSCNEF